MNRRTTLKIAIVYFLSSWLGNIAYAQHDAHREAVIDIAKGDYDTAEERIKKVMRDPAALWPGLTNAYERAGKTVQSEGGEYQRFVIPENHFLMAMLASLRGDSATALAYARNAVKGGLPFERLLAGPRDVFSTLHQMKAFQEWAEDESRVLIHGPMLGNITSNATSFWVRTAYETEVQVLVKPTGNSSQKNTKSAVIRTSADTDYTAVVRIDGLLPHTTYDYHLIIGGNKIPVENASFKTYPIQGSPHQFSVAFGGGAGYVPENERIWTTIKQRDPLAMLLLGDNIYSDDPQHAITQKYCYYRRQSRPEWRQLIVQKGVYAIWDDHDFGTDDSYGGPGIDDPSWKRPVWKVFKQNWNNPSYAGGSEQPGCWFDFYIGDVHFIHLDCRYYRESSGRLDPRVDRPSMLGPVQLDWLKKTLRNSKGTFKVLISSVPWAPGTKGGPPGSLDTWDGYIEERDTIYNYLHNNKVSGVVMLSADRHRSDVRRITRENGYDLYDFMSSVLTNYHTHPVVKTPGLIFGYNEKNSFGMIHFNTEADDPKLTFEIVSIDNESIWSMDLKLGQLDY